MFDNQVIAAGKEAIGKQLDKEDKTHNQVYRKDQQTLQPLFVFGAIKATEQKI